MGAYTSNLVNVYEAQRNNQPRNRIVRNNTGAAVPAAQTVTVWDKVSYLEGFMHPDKSADKEAAKLHSKRNHPAGGLGYHNGCHDHYRSFLRTPHHNKHKSRHHVERKW